MTVVNKFNVNKQQVTLGADIIENMSANDVSYNASTQYDENTVGDKVSKLESQVIYDVTVNNDGVTFASLSALLSDENLSTLIPSTVRCGGMSIRFVQSSDNKYVQYFLTKDEWSANAADWQKLNLEKEVKELSWYQKSQKEVVCSSPDGYTRCDFVNDKRYRIVVTNGSIDNVYVSLRNNSSVSISQSLQFVDGVADFICNYDGIHYISLIPATNVTFDLYEYEHIYDVLEELGTQVSINTENIEEAQNQLVSVEEIKEDKIFNSLEVIGISSNTFISKKFVKDTKYRITILDGALSQNVYLAKDSENLYLQKLTFNDGVSYFTCNVNDANYIFNSPATNVTLKIEENISIKEIHDTVVSNKENLVEINSQLDYIKKSTKTINCTSSNAYTNCILNKGTHYTLKIQDGSIGTAVWLSVNSEDTYKQKLKFVDGVSDFICEYDNITYIFNSPAANVTFELTTFESLPELSETVNRLNGNNINFNNIVYDKHLANDKKSYTGNGTNYYILLSDIGYKKGNVYFIANFIDDGYRIAQSDTDGGQFFYVSPTFVDMATYFGYYNITKDYIVLTNTFLPAHNITFIHPIEERINDVDSKLDSTKNELMQYTKNYVKVYSHNAICSFVDDDMSNRVATVWGTILNDTGIRAGFACITGRVGTEPYATLSDVQTLYNGGNEIYSHSFDHHAFYENETTPEIIEEECWKSKTWLLNNGFIRNADTIVYPGGININPAKEEVIRRHFRYGVNSTAGEAGNADPVNRYCISRVNADRATLEELKRYVDNAIINKRLLVFMTHSNIIDTNEQIEKIKALIKYIQENNTLILPLREALNQIYGYNN